MTVRGGSGGTISDGGLSGRGLLTEVAAATLPGAGALSASARLIEISAATLAGSGNLSGSLSKLAYQIEANLSGSGGLSVSALLNLAAAAQFAGVGGLSGDASSRAPIMAEAIFAGSGNLSANLNGILAALANLDGSGSFLGDLILAASAPVPDNAIATTNYSLHPVNCLMIDKGPLSSLKKKVTEWNIPKPDTKERATATKSQPAKLVKRLTIPKSWLQ